VASIIAPLSLRLAASADFSRFVDALGYAVGGVAPATARRSRAGAGRRRAPVTGCTRTHVLFATRDGQPLHAMSRRALLQLREQGLATTIESPHPVRRAVDTLTLDLDAPG